MANEADANSGRDQLAHQVIFWSGIGIALVSLALIIATAARQPASLGTVVTTVFNTLIPLFGTWVGTVLAFYFSRENYAAAAKTTKDLVQQLGDGRLKQIAVKDAWIPVAAIDAITAPDDTCPFSEIRAKLSTKVSRVPIWNADKVVRYVVHESVIFEFLADHAEKRVQAASATPPQPAPPAPTLQDFLDFMSDGVPMRTTVKKIVWVAQTATLADAKAKMESLPDCQDIFVTNTGTPTEGVLGWITNADIAKKAKA
jgi:hypothetical protein